MNSSSLRRTALPAVAILTVGLALTACGNNSSSGSSGGDTLSGGGATSQANAQTAWRADYQKANGGTINYEEVGSGTGVENFTSKAYSFAGTDAYLTSDQMTAAAKACGSDVVEVPAYVSPIAVAFNLSGVKSLNLDAKTIADIFNGKITKWDDPAIAQQNSGVKLPEHRDRDDPPLGRVGYDVQLHRLPQQGRRRCVDRRRPTRCGRRASPGARASTAPPA